MKPAFAKEFLSRIEQGKVAAVGVPSLEAPLADLENFAEQELSPASVALQLIKIPGHDQLIAVFVRSPAAAATLCGRADMGPTWTQKEKVMRRWFHLRQRKQKLELAHHFYT